MKTNLSPHSLTSYMSPSIVLFVFVLLSPFASLSSPWFVLSVSLSRKVHAFFILMMTLRTWFLKFTSVS